MKKISYKELKKLCACSPGLDWFEENFGLDGKATFDELLECGEHTWISWLIFSVPAYQTSENLEKYLEMNKTDYSDFSWLISFVPAYKTPENLEKYLEMNKTDYSDFSYLIKSVPDYKTPENLEILEKYKNM